MSPEPSACRDACLRILTARQKPGGPVRIRQQDSAERHGFTQSVASHALGQLRNKGILSERLRTGTVLIHPLLAGYESLAHMVNHLKEPEAFVRPLNFPQATSGLRGPRCPDRH
ncbi:hypothetical protein [Streptomyces sp. NRRL S-448]|uniref:hypothetical protein n=1 Tax=Streptomyces sp. NRRL S-448 TaxID=1463907 RepID=UPI0035695AB9